VKKNQQQHYCYKEEHALISASLHRSMVL